MGTLGGEKIPGYCVGKVVRRRITGNYVKPKDACTYGGEKQNMCKHNKSHLTKQTGREIPAPTTPRPSGTPGAFPKPE